MEDVTDLSIELKLPGAGGENARFCTTNTHNTCTLKLTVSVVRGLAICGKIVVSKEGLRMTTCEIYR